MLIKRFLSQFQNLSQLEKSELTKYKKKKHYYVS